MATYLGASSSKCGPPFGSNALNDASLQCLPPLSSAASAAEHFCSRELVSFLDFLGEHFGQAVSGSQASGA